MKSSPVLQNRYVTAANKKHGNVKDAIRLLKIWKGNRYVPVSSFYLEMAVARYATNHVDFDRTVAMYSVLLDMAYDSVPSFTDPSTYVSQIEGCSGPTNRAETTSKAKTAHENISRAMDAAIAAGDQDAATPYLKRVFGESGQM
jgi:hypothetical protein